jgi:hypothetical protein
MGKIRSRLEIEKQDAPAIEITTKLEDFDEINNAPGMISALQYLIRSTVRRYLKRKDPLIDIQIERNRP